MSGVSTQASGKDTGQAADVANPSSLPLLSSTYRSSSTLSKACTIPAQFHSHGSNSSEKSRFLLFAYCKVIFYCLITRWKRFA